MIKSAFVVRLREWAIFSVNAEIDSKGEHLRQLLTDQGLLPEVRNHKMLLLHFQLKYLRIHFCHRLSDFYCLAPTIQTDQEAVTGGDVIGAHTGCDIVLGGLHHIRFQLHH